MIPQEKSAKVPRHPYRVDPQRCVGCVICMEACPSRAIRVRQGVATIRQDLCSDCGVCYRSCPHGAVEVTTSRLEETKAYRYAVAAASPALFAQFGYKASPNQILHALKRVGFAEVVDLAWLSELCAAAFQEYLLTNPWLRPGISPTCPVVLRLIAQRFPSLIPNVIPLAPPRLLAAKGLKTRIARAHGWAESDVGVFSISPCPARLYLRERPVIIQRPYLDGVICIQEAYGPILKALKEMGDQEPEEVIQKATGVGLSFAMSGGQAEAVKVGHTLAVSGFDEVVNILERLEAGRLQDLSFIEAMICPDGCLGGPLTVENRYRAQSVMRPLIHRYGTQSAADRGRVVRAMEAGLFEWETELEPQAPPPLAPSPMQALAVLREINELEERLPGGECGACGSPDCRTFAEDVVMGRVGEDACPFLPPARPLTLEEKEVDAVTVKDIVEKLSLEVVAGAAGLDREVKGGYASDMLSDVMAHAGEGILWLTVQTHGNVPAVAVLKELAGVCLVGGKRPGEETLAKAEEEGIPLLVSPDDAFTLAGKLHGLGLGS